MRINFIDTHIHVWDLEAVDYPWLKGNSSILNRTYALDELEPARKAAGVVGGVLVQAANSLEDTELMLRVAKAHPWIGGIVGWVPLQDPEATGRLLEEGYRPGGLLKGVRHLIHDEADPQWLLQDTVLESLGLLAERGVPYDLVGVLPEHILTALRVAERWPELRMIFDHLNQPGGAEWEDLMKTAAGHDRFYVKISGLAWDKRDIAPYIGYVLQHFGADRCCCGGDWPVSLLAGSYEKTLNTYRTVLANCLDPGGQEKVLFKNAERFYRL